MKILIAGLGSIGRRHLKNLVHLGVSDIVLYRTLKSSLPDEEIGNFPVEMDLKKAFSSHPDAVIISNPTAMHMPIAELAAKANCHIFIEKPISHTIESLGPFEAALKKSTSVVFVGFQFRFNSGLKSVKKIIDDQVIGRPISFRSHWGEYLPGWHPWEDYRKSYAADRDMGGGVVLTLSHPLDYLRWIFGEVKELYAVTGKFSDLEIKSEDTAEVLITFMNNVVGGLHLDYYQQPKKHYLSIICSDGTIYWEYETNRVLLEKASGEIVEMALPDNYERNQMYLAEMQHFLNICEKGVKPICGYSDGKKSLELARGILQSGRYNKRIILNN